jgi:hypothetical protein
MHFYCFGFVWLGVSGVCGQDKGKGAGTMLNEEFNGDIADA